MTTKTRGAAAILIAGFIVGLFPALTALTLDPFGLIGWRQLDFKTMRAVEKRHGPLYKMIAYRRQPQRVLVLGDSRSRALREKLFHEIGRTEVFNFAYSGGTIPELVDSYWFAASQGKLDAVVIGAPLRMFTHRYKNGKNLAAEALAILDRPVDYFSSWLVFDTALSTVGLRAPDVGDIVGTVAGLVVPGAKAADLSVGTRTYGQCRRVCAETFGVTLNPATAMTPRPAAEEVPAVIPQPPQPTTPQPQEIVAPAETYPRKWRKQIDRAAASDWRSFEYAESYFEAIAAIVAHARANGTKVLFFIPPTPTVMQQRIVDFDRLPESLRHRKRLAELAPVYDFDFPNQLTDDVELFSDAYHFNARFARQIVHEISLWIDPADAQTRKLVEKRRKGVRCPDADTLSAGVTVGDGCLVWSGT